MLERFFFLDDADPDLVAKRRGDHNRLGFALQLVTVRHLGRFLEDPLDVPTVIVDYVASQVGVADPSCVKAYLERAKTKLEHHRRHVPAYRPARLRRRTVDGACTQRRHVPGGRRRGAGADP
ncbi:DUF4158 domain-containing protein [Dactylosporangium fulvum]|uniref:DUF4158 domain-containing protein n=1 Tax=Dactylosporangium fulvum TaxID=53359 RepID=A0ABY5VNZ7_9ACTN|nr:DUF4158 domain-containing protein [Dactylosporangium fulvum]UWP78496.1 DUF4158 domain-containing protein [Dactylosporangium fulvum]